MFAKDMGTFQRTSQRGGRNPARVAVTNQCTAALDGMLSSSPDAGLVVRSSLFCVTSTTISRS